MNVASIPLCLAIGPSLDVQFRDEGTRRWLQETLCENVQEIESHRDDEAPWWRNNTRQSNLGILVKVDGRQRDKTETTLTELLLYATVEPDDALLPTPPTSSSPSQTHAAINTAPPREDVTTFSFHALPLCSDVLLRAQRASQLCTPPPEDGEAFFLPDNATDLEAAVKRRKISSVFEAATKQRRRSKAKGGEGVAKAMASLHDFQQSTTVSQPLQRMDDTAGPVKGNRKSQKATLTRAASDSSISLASDFSRPPSRPSTATGRKRSSLHRVESAYTPREDSIMSDANPILEQNKEALSKIIMAGMRLHGLQQRKKLNTESTQFQHSRKSSLADIGTTGPTSDDEYKLVYHQTLKSALFAFRSHCSIRLINQVTMRDVVDKMLDLFCTDPLTPQLMSDGFPMAPDTTLQERDNPFDAPMSSAPKTEEVNVWSTPFQKKRKTGINQEAG